jgi:glycosyltransferase involved in cell wall biosynthesis
VWLIGSSLLVKKIFYLHLFEINVLASKEEALPLSLFEGAACGLPNVGSLV